MLNEVQLFLEGDTTEYIELAYYCKINNMFTANNLLYKQTRMPYIKKCKYK